MYACTYKDNIERKLLELIRMVKDDLEYLVVIGHKGGRDSEKETSNTT